MAAVQRYTWDGLPIAPEQPHGAAVMVRRPAAADVHEYLILHRAHHGREYAGDWAWTPPSGSRQPGESVLGSALRELSEESGLSAVAADLAALDLGGPWVRFRLDVPAGAQARLDHEHDAFEWLPAAEAIARCHPDAVADGIRMAEAAMSVHIAFRPLAQADLPALLEWQSAPHAARWFPERLDLAAAERKYGPRIARRSPTKVHVAVVDGRDVGFLQHYRVGDYPDYAAATGLPDAIGLDYAIGLPELTNRGLGPQLIWAYLRDIALCAHPAARQAQAGPDIANYASIRALEKAGFQRARQVAIPGEPGPEQLCVLDLDRFFGERGAAAQ
ncbi:MAG TPA: GNAT family N-acetyltransferase [Streptosporangiaceae bacterium]|nr:GNAT family N-acetyltransferase [Streptosporangiaceae bacterium]